MPPKDFKLILKWFQYAAEDLRLAKYGMEASPPFLKGSSFHAQQCAEKAMKGFLLSNGREAPRTHDLRGLSEIVYEIQPDLEKLLGSVGTLTKYVTASRYPTDINLSKDMVQDAIKIAEKVFEELHNRVSKKS